MFNKFACYTTKELTQKYQDASEFLVLKSLSYFDDAEDEEMPIMFIDLEWDEVKQNISYVLNRQLNN